MTNSPKEQVAEVTKTLADTGLYFTFQRDKSDQPVRVLAPFSSGHGDLVVEIRISLTGSILYVYHWIRLSKQPPRELLAHLLKINREGPSFAKVGILEEKPGQNWASVSAQLSIRHLDKTSLAETIGAVLEVSRKVRTLSSASGYLSS